MDERKWHLEHADGRAWTQVELDDLASRLKLETRIAPYNQTCYGITIDERCDPVLLGDTWGEWYYVDDPDMVVVWDE